MKRYNVFDANNLYVGYVIAKSHDKALQAATTRYGQQARHVVISALTNRSYAGE